MSPEWQSVSAAINIIVGLSILVAFYRFVIASWTKLSLVADIVLDIASLAVIYQITQFSQFIVLNQDIAIPEKWSKLFSFIDSSVYSILGVIALISVWDIYSNARKLIRG